MRMPPFHSFDKFCFDAEKGFGKQFVRLDDEKTKLFLAFKCSRTKHASSEGLSELLKTVRGTGVQENIGTEALNI